MKTKIEKYTKSAHSITSDNCHKIYILGDVRQTNEMISYGYQPHLVTNKIEVLQTLLE